MSGRVTYVRGPRDTALQVAAAAIERPAYHYPRRWSQVVTAGGQQVTGLWMLGYGRAAVHCTALGPAAGPGTIMMRS